MGKGKKETLDADKRRYPRTKDAEDFPRTKDAEDMTLRLKARRVTIEGLKNLSIEELKN